MMLLEALKIMSYALLEYTTKTFPSPHMVVGIKNKNVRLKTPCIERDLRH